jgi:hypothetical protein
MQFAFQAGYDRDTAIVATLEKRWQHYYGELLDKPLNPMGVFLRKNRHHLQKMSGTEFDRENLQNIIESITASENGIAPLSQFLQDKIKNDKVFCLSALSKSMPVSCSDFQITSSVALPDACARCITSKKYPNY